MDFDTKKYRIGTEFLVRENGNHPNYHIVGGDFGNSANKAYGPHGMSRFPGYAIRLDSLDQISVAQPHTIQLEDLESGELWLIGAQAQDLISARVSISEDEQYSRYRWRSKIFRPLVMASLGTTFRDKGEQKKRILLQTALPDAEMRDDRGEFRDILAGIYNFRLKVGTGEWRAYNFEIMRENVYVMEQARATLFSACMDSAMNATADRESIMSKKTLVIDGGFGTLNLYPFWQGFLKKGTTYRDLGMERVLHDTCEILYEKYGRRISVPAMQGCLEEGTIRVPLKGKRGAKSYAFGDILEEVSKKVCYEALERVDQTYNFMEYQNLVLGGGTCAAWEGYIREWLKDFDDLNLITADRNDTLDPVFSVSRGLFDYRYLKAYQRDQKGE